MSGRTPQWSRPNQRPGPAEAGHDLVGDEQDAVSRADLGDRRPVVVGRDDSPEGGPDDRLGEERGDATRAGLADGGVELGGERRAVAEGVRLCLAGPVRVGRRYVPEPAEPRLVRLAKRGRPPASRAPRVLP